MSSNISEMMQLIYYDLSFNQNFENLIENSGMKQLGKNYNTVAIIGCQSSGKSTLLNNLFNSKFQVMEEDKGRGQTTQGIWVSSNLENKVLILDCEGTDSKERGEERFKFEHCSSLFCLAMADLLIINMWTNDVGRYTASNYGVLKIVFEMNLKLFQQECAKRILIVLRDFDERYDVKERISNIIMDDINNIWKEIKKPEKFKDYSPDKFFEFEFTTLSHLFFFKDKFESEILELKKRLIPDNRFYLFRHVSSEKTVPVDGVSLYCQHVWNDILCDKDLNIPTQKEMLANFKCNEIKDIALLTVEPDIDKLITESSMKIMDHFRARCEAIQKSAYSIYDPTAKNYLSHVYLEVKKQLDNSLSQKMYVCYEHQANKLIPVYQKNMRNELEKELAHNDNFIQCALTTKKRLLDSIVRQLDNLRYFDKWDLSLIEYEELFDEIIESLKKFSLENKKTETIKKLKILLEDLFMTKLDDISIDFWADFNQEYFNYVNSILFGLKDFLKEYYNVEDLEFQQFVEDLDTEVFIAGKKELYKKMKEISNYAVESFRRGFWYEDSVPRVWNKITEKEIDQLFDQHRDKNLYIFDCFKKFKLLKNPLKYFKYQKPEEEELSQIIINIKFYVEDEENQNFDNLLSKEDIKGIRTKYDESIQNIYEDAKRKHSNIQKQTVPIWTWILIIYLGYEDIYRLIQSYWIIPAIISLSIYGTLNIMGMGHVPKMIFNIIKNTLLAPK